MKKSLTYCLVFVLPLVASVLTGCSSARMQSEWVPGGMLPSPLESVAQREARLDELEQFVVFSAQAPTAIVAEWVAADSVDPVELAEPADLSPRVAVQNPASQSVAKTHVSKPVPVSRHMVISGDTLGHIAQKYLGDAGRWEEIWNANPALIDPARLRVGQSLMIPDVATAKLAPSPVPMTETPEPMSGFLAHTVVSGDSIRSLAARYLGNPDFWHVLAQANPGLQAPYTIHQGQVLAIPSGEQVEQVLMAFQAASVPPGEQGYTVRAGDTLGAIAKHYLGDASLWQVVMDANPSLTDPRAIRPGQVLVIPAHTVA